MEWTSKKGVTGNILKLFKIPFLLAAWVIAIFVSGCAGNIENSVPPPNMPKADGLGRQVSCCGYRRYGQRWKIGCRWGELIAWNDND
jgi:hypothetical protein